MKKSLLVFLSVIVIVIFFGPAKLKANSDGFEKVYCEATIEDEFIDNQILVVVGKEKSLNYYDFKNSDFINIGCINIEDLTASRKEEVLARVNEEENNINLDTFRRILLLTLNKNDKQNVLDCIKKLEKREDIYSAEPNFIINRSNGSYVNTDLGYEIGTNDVIYTWASSAIDINDAWSIEEDVQDLEQIYVGIIDYGIRADESVDNGCEPELIGKVDQNLSRDFISDGITNINNSLVEFGTAHGTFVSGIIAARRNDFFGIEGISKTAKLVSLRIEFEDNVIDENENCENGNLQLIEAIIYAGTNNIKILNASFGVYNYYSNVVYNAILNYNGLIICGAGNNGINIDNNEFYPASYPADNIITVGASDINDDSWIKSNYGVESVDLFAPGVNIVSVGNIGAQLSEEGFENYYIASGTSFAAPYVAGLAAMI